MPSLESIRAAQLDQPRPRGPREGRAQSPRSKTIHRAIIAAAVPLFLTMQMGAMLLPVVYQRGRGVNFVAIAAVLAGFLVASGVLFAVLTLIEQSTEAKQARARPRRAGDPWNTDNRWDPKGISVSHAGAKRRRTRLDWIPFVVLALLVVAAFPLRLPWLGIAAVCGMIVWSIWRGVHASGLGTAHLSFRKFPIHPGERAEFTFGFDEGGANFEHVRYVLRRYVESPDGPNGRDARCSAVAQIEYAPPEGLLPGPDQYVTLSFDIPEDAGGTQLSARWPCYWELEVVGRTNRGPYRVLFLIPIYDRPAAPAAT